VGPRAGLDRRGKSRPHRDSIPDRPARSAVAIPTELPGPQKNTYTHYIYIYIYTGCNRRNEPDFGRVFLMLYYTDIT